MPVFGGRVFRTPRYRFQLATSGSASLQGDGTLEAAFSARLTTRTATNAVQWTNGLGMEMTGGTATGQNVYTVAIPAIGLSWSQSAGYSLGASMTADLLDLRVYWDSLPTWRVVFSGVEIAWGGGSTTLGGGEIFGGHYAPAWLPLLGIPALLEGEIDAGATNLPGYPWAWTGTGNLQIVGGWRAQDESGAWMDVPMTLPTIELPPSPAPESIDCYGIASGAFTHEATLNLQRIGRGEVRDFGGYWFGQSETVSDRGGRIWIVGDPEKRIVRVDETDHVAPWKRFGVPSTFSTAGRSGTGATVDGNGFPIAVSQPVFVSQTAQVHASHGEALGIAGTAAHAIEAPFSEPVYAPIVVAAARQRSTWVGIDPTGGPQDSSQWPTITSHPFTSASSGFGFPGFVQMRARTSPGGPPTNPGMLQYLDWDDLEANQSEISRVVNYYSYRSAPQWSTFDVLTDSWLVNGAPASLGDYWLVNRQVHNAFTGAAGPFVGTRSHNVSDPWDQGGNAGLMTAIFGVPTHWAGAGDFDPIPLDGTAGSLPFVRPAERAYGVPSASLYLPGEVGDDPPTVDANGVEIPAGDAAFEIQLASWSVTPYALALTCDRVRCGLPASSNVSRLRAYLVAADDFDGEPETKPTRTEIVFDPPITGTGSRVERFPSGKGRAWFTSAGIEFGADVLGDTYEGVAPPADDASIAFTVDGLKESAPPLPPARTGVRLRVVVTPVDETLPCRALHPVLLTAPLANARVLPETARHAAILMEYGPGVRTGTHEHFDYPFDAITPVGIAQPKMDRMLTVGDMIGFLRTHIEGRAADDDLSGALAALYDAPYEATDTEHLWREPENFGRTSLAGVVPGANGHPVLLLGSGFKAAPPHPFTPRRRRERASSWRRTGDVGLYTYSHRPARFWAYSPHPANVRPKLLDALGEDVLTDAPAGHVPNGWGAGYHFPVTNGSEGYDLTLSVPAGSTFRDIAKVRPWRGYEGIYGRVPSESAPFIAYAVDTGFHRHRRIVGYDGTIDLGKAGNDLNWSEMSLGIDADAGDLAITRDGKAELLFLAILDGTGRVLSSASDGETWIERVTGLAAVDGAIVGAQDTRRYVYRLTEAGDVYASAYDASWTLLGTETLAVTDAAAVDADESVTQDTWRIVLAVVAGDGTRTTYESPDGLNFTLV